MSVDVQIACSEETPPAERIAGWARAALNGDDRDVCLRVVDASEALALNARFRSRQRAANVLAFPAEESTVLGDIAICASVAAREALAQHKPLADHFAHLVVHGVLHLLGMDHVGTEEAAAMEAKEVELLRRFGIADPYAECSANAGASP